jgi:hypothetical protein
MTTPIVIEITPRPHPVTTDPFISDLDAKRGAASPPRA